MPTLKDLDSIALETHKLPVDVESARIFQDESDLSIHAFDRFRYTLSFVKLLVAKYSRKALVQSSLLEFLAT